MERKRERKGANPPNYQEQVKAREFTDFLRSHGISTEEISSRQCCTEDSASVKGRLHYGMKLLISNSTRDKRVKARQGLERLLIHQAGMYLAKSSGEVLELGREINDFLKDDELKTMNNAPLAENMEVDMYVHGCPVKASHSEIMGIQADVIPLHLCTPEARPAMPLHRPHRMTPSAKGDSNVINVGEAAGTSDECLPKKVAQLERALTYALYRAGKQYIEEVVGYRALCMSMVNGSSLAYAMISLHAEIFPLLAQMQKKGGLAYLFSNRSVFDDVQKALDSCGSLQQQLKMYKWLTWLSLGIGLVAWLTRRRTQVSS